MMKYKREKISTRSSLTIPNPVYVVLFEDGQDQTIDIKYGVNHSQNAGSGSGHFHFVLFPNSFCNLHQTSNIKPDISP